MSANFLQSPCMRADCTHNNVLWLPETFENIVEGGDYFVVLISSLNAEAEAPEKRRHEK